MANFYYKIAAIITVVVLVAGIITIILPNKFQFKKRVEPVEFVIENGQSLNTTARLLAKRNLIMSRYVFVAYAIVSGNERTFKAGKYLVAPSASIAELVKTFSSGNIKNEDLEVTIPEGTNIADIDKIFAEAGLIGAGGILNYFRSSGSWPEGELFPDTYRFKPSEPDDNLVAGEIAQKMRENFLTKTGSIFAGHSTGGGMADKAYKIVIIASILEKEVRTENDMRLVAGIIEKRLDLGIPLELDASVAYGVCYREFLAGRYCDVSLANIVDNISVDSDYNTYRKKGLPAGPISNPGLKAIRAALNPQSSEYLFYLSAKDGTTVFSRTIAEHLKAKQKYLKR